MIIYPGGIASNAIKNGSVVFMDGNKSPYGELIYSYNRLRLAIDYSTWPHTLHQLKADAYAAYFCRIRYGTSIKEAHLTRGFHTPSELERIAEGFILKAAQIIMDRRLTE